MTYIEAVTNHVHSPPALFAILRLPEVLKANPIASAILKLVASTAERKYENIYPRAQELFIILKNTHVPGVDFQTTVDILLLRFFGTSITIPARQVKYADTRLN